MGNGKSRSPPNIDASRTLLVVIMVAFGLFVLLSASNILPVSIRRRGAIPVASSNAGSRIHVDGLGFVDQNGRQFVPIGTSLYWIRESASLGRYEAIDKVLEEAKKIGMNVIRVWGFADGREGLQSSMQPEPGIYDEDGFQGLDFVVYKAGEKGLHSIIVFADFWESYGGATKYVNWAREAGENVSEPGDFFNCSLCRDWFQKYMRHVLERKNVYTGYTYNQDPRIVAYELMNEPRRRGDDDGTILYNWISDMANEFKKLDGTHPLSCGVDGFFGGSTPKQGEIGNPYDTADAEGTDFLRIFQLRSLDFAMYHMHVDEWVDGGSFEEKVEAMNKWIDTHVNMTTHLLKKPLMLSEYSKSTPISERADFMQRLYNKLEQNAEQRNAALGGDLIWMLSVKEYDCGETHEFSICSPEEEPTVTALKGHANGVKKLSGV